MSYTGQSLDTLFQHCAGMVDNVGNCIVLKTYFSHFLKCVNIKHRVHNVQIFYLGNAIKHKTNNFKYINFMY